MDITETLAPKSDQMDAVDLTEPRTFTVEKVSAGASAEQPVNVFLAEFPRPWRPGKSMRRVLAKAWGTDASKWAGRRLTLFCDPDVKFGGIAVGGIRVSHVSHIDKALHVPLLITRGKSAVWKVEPLRESASRSSKPANPTPEQIAALTDVDALRELWSQVADEQIKAIIVARVNELRANPDTGEIGGDE